MKKLLSILAILSAIVLTYCAFAGQAQITDLHYTQDNITDVNHWDLYASSASDMSDPILIGTIPYDGNPQTEYHVSLTWTYNGPDGDYYFAMITYDDYSRASDYSNVVMKTVAFTGPNPAVILDIIISGN